MARQKWRPQSLWAYHPFETLAKEAKQAFVHKLLGLALMIVVNAFLIAMVVSGITASIHWIAILVFYALALLLLGVEIAQFYLGVWGLEPEAYEEGLLVVDRRLLSAGPTILIPWDHVSMSDFGAPDTPPGAPAKGLGKFRIEARLGGKVVFDKTYRRHGVIGEADSEGLYEVVAKRTAQRQRARS